jgi:hypothetical protein
LRRKEHSTEPADCGIWTKSKESLVTAGVKFKHSNNGRLGVDREV